ncbi:MAG: alpha/beta hydrolase [Planctomycetota bacterium]
MIELREYGADGPRVIALHGGPGARGSLAPVAEGLAGSFRVLEPLQRVSGDELLTVADHVADLDEVILDRWEGGPPALVGSSWGAMLALVYAAEHPERAGPLALVGNGTWDTAARAVLQETIRERLSEEDRARLATLAEDHPDPAERMDVLGGIILPVFSVDKIAIDAPPEEFDAKGNVETWADMVRLQEAGVYPAAFAAIRSPVIMLHGDYDPHPGRMIRDGLLPVLPDLEYVEFERCGHDPWVEREAREPFFAALIDWLGKHAT